MAGWKQSQMHLMEVYSNHRENQHYRRYLRLHLAQAADSILLTTQAHNMWRSAWKRTSMPQAPTTIWSDVSGILDYLLKILNAGQGTIHFGTITAALVVRANKFAKSPARILEAGMRKNRWKRGKAEPRTASRRAWATRLTMKTTQRR